MRTRYFVRGSYTLWLVIVALLLVACAPTVPSAMSVDTTMDSAEYVLIENEGQVPFYARFGENETFGDGEWGVIVFYRPPECIPLEFNLNQFFHLPSADDPGAFACNPPTTTGIESWENGPDVDPAPVIAETKGLGAVPVWLIADADLVSAMADGEVTISELAALPSLRKGTASTYEEYLRPSQSNQQAVVQFIAAGALDDGSPFAVDVSAGAVDIDDHVMIDIGAPAAAVASADAAPTVTFTATEYAYDGPAEIAGGLTRIELVNAGEQPHGLWVFNLADGKGLDDVMGFMGEMEENAEIPAWLSFYGGVSAPPGASAAYTVDLPAGDYLLISIEGDEEEVPDVVKGMSATLTVTESAAAAAAPPAADMTMELVDFSFVVDGTPKAGPQIIEVTNTGMEPHEVAMLSLTDGVTVQDAIEFMMAGEEAQGPPSFDFYGGTGPQSAGVTAWYEIDFAPGEYGLICFISSAANEGAPHFMLGMTAQMSVAN